MGALALAGVACSSPITQRAARAPWADLVEVDAALQRRSLGWTDPHAETFSAILAQALGEDPHLCLPHPDRVFDLGPDGWREAGTRLVRSRVPHYGFFHGPVRYGVQRARAAWRVSAYVLVHSEWGGELELAGCEAPADGPGGSCEGVAYADAPGTDVCPASGTFRAPRTREAVRALLARWSTDVEELYNRDAARFGLPVSYDFEFALSGELHDMPRVDVELPLEPTCGRTPYFASLRSGWSTPILAHEMGHWLGLIDEYEMLSGIVAAYPKTPFPGAEISRMGLSMKRGTVLLPIHHYLVLRRFYCAASPTDPYRLLLAPPSG